MDGFVGNQAVEAMEAAEESTLLNLPVAGADFFFLMKKTASLFFRPRDGSKVQKKPTDGFILALFFCIYFYFWLAWREHPCTNWNGLHGRSEVAAWGSICRSIWDSSVKVCALHTCLEIEKLSFLFGVGH